MKVTVDVGGLFFNRTHVLIFSRKDAHVISSLRATLPFAFLNFLIFLAQIFRAMQILLFFGIFQLLLDAYTVPISDTWTQHKDITTRTTVEEDETIYEQNVNRGRIFWECVQYILNFVDYQQFSSINRWRELGAFNRRPLGPKYCGPGAILHTCQPAACECDFAGAEYLVSGVESFRMRWSAESGLVISQFENITHERGEVIQSWPTILMSIWDSACRAHQPEPKSTASLQSLVLGPAKDRDTRAILRRMRRNNNAASLDNPIDHQSDYFLPLLGTFWGSIVLFVLAQHVKDLVKENPATNDVETVKSLQSIRLVKRQGIPQDVYDFYFELQDVPLRNQAQGNDGADARVQPHEPQVPGLDSILSSNSWLLQGDLEQGSSPSEGSFGSEYSIDATFASVEHGQEPEAEEQDPPQSNSSPNTESDLRALMDDEQGEDPERTTSPSIEDRPESAGRQSTTTSHPESSSAASVHDGSRCCVGFWGRLCGCGAKPSVV